MIGAAAGVFTMGVDPADDRKEGAGIGCVVGTLDLRERSDDLLKRDRSASFWLVPVAARERVGGEVSGAGSGNAGSCWVSPVEVSCSGFRGLAGVDDDAEAEVLGRRRICG